jgi:hypothetical protein
MWDKTRKVNLADKGTSINVWGMIPDSRPVRARIPALTNVSKTVPEPNVSRAANETTRTSIMPFARTRTFLKLFRTKLRLILRIFRRRTATIRNNVRNSVVNA